VIFTNENSHDRNGNVEYFHASDDHGVRGESNGRRACPVSVKRLRLPHSRWYTGPVICLDDGRILPHGIGKIRSLSDEVVGLWASGHYMLESRWHKGTLQYIGGFRWNDDGLYWGDWKQGPSDGMAEGVPEGNGRKVYADAPDRYSYVGQWKAAKRHGQGTLLFENEQQ
jgi:hypothetical protein